MSEPTTDALLKRAREAGKHWLAACLRIGMDEQVVMPLAAEQSAALAALADRVQVIEDNRTTWMYRAADAKATVTRLEKAMRDLYDDAGVDDIDQRLDYVMLQVGRDEWNNFVAAVKP